MELHDLIRNILFSSEISQFPWNFSHEGSCIQARTVVIDTRLYHDSEQACELKSTASFGLTEVFLLLLYEIPHLFPKWQNLASIQHSFEYSPNTRHSPGVLAYILFFPVFHLFVDLSIYFILADFAFLIMETLSLWSTALPLLALKWSWILPPCAQEN